MNASLAPELGYADTLWKTADKLRGNMESHWA